MDNEDIVTGKVGWLNKLNEYRVLDITVIGKGSVPPDIHGALVLRSTCVSDILDTDILRQRILEYVHLQNLDKHPVSLSRLNRIFGRAARKLGWSTRQVSNDLMSSGQFVAFARNGKAGLITKVIWTQLPAVYEALGVHLEEALDAWALRTL